MNKYKGCLLQEMKKMLPNLLHHYEISDVGKGKLEHSMILQEKESKRKIAKTKLGREIFCQEGGGHKTEFLFFFVGKDVK